MSHNPHTAQPDDWSRYIDKVAPASESFDRAQPLARLFLSPDGDDNRIAPAWHEVLADNSPGDRLGAEHEIALFTYIAAAPWAPAFYAALNRNRKATVYAVRDGSSLNLTPKPQATTLLVVEDPTTRDALRQGFEGFERVWVVDAMGRSNDLRGRRFSRIYVRYPSPNWFVRRRVPEADFSTWVRSELSPRLIRGGDFQYI